MTTTLYSSGKQTKPSFISSYANGNLQIAATYANAGTYNLEVIATDNITQESPAAAFTLTVQGCHSTCKTCYGVLST